LSGQIAELPFVAPYDAVFLADLEELDTTRYKLVLVLNAFKLDAEQRRVVKQKLATGGKVVVWYYAPGYFSEGRHRGAAPTEDSGGDVAHIRDLTDLNVVREAGVVADGTALFPGGEGGDAQNLRLLKGDSFVVNDPDATVLATRPDGQVVMAEKRSDAWTSIYTAAAPLTAPVVRRLAAAAGVHLYHEKATDLVFANRHTLTIGADWEGGERVIRLPRRTTVTDLTTGATVCQEADQFTVSLEPKEVRMFFLR
jgi:hypothetical protein